MVLWGHLFEVSLGAVILVKQRTVLPKTVAGQRRRPPATLPGTQVWEGITSVDEAQAVSSDKEAKCIVYFTTVYNIQMTFLFIYLFFQMTFLMS